MSTARQRRGFSLETQLVASRQHAANLGYVVSEGDIYLEVHRGIDLDRPRLNALRSALRNHQVDLLVCYAVDRLSRNPAHLGCLLAEANRFGVTVSFVTEPVADSAEGQVALFIRAYAAAVEQEKTRERAMRGRLARVQSGRLLASARPRFGYRWRDNSKAALDEDMTTGPIVRWMFARVAAGRTIRSVAAALTRDGVPLPSGKLGIWRTATIRQLLEDSIYTGLSGGLRYRMDSARNQRTGRIYRHVGLRPDAERVPLPAGVVPALITTAEFAAVQERLRLNKERIIRTAIDREGALLWGGFARCGYCGRALAVVWKNLQYRCMANCDSPGACRQRPSISAGVLDPAVWTWMEARHRVEQIGSPAAATRAMIERLGVRATVWRFDHEPRFAIEATNVS